MLRVLFSLCVAVALGAATIAPAQDGVDFSREVFDAAGVPHSLAPWLISIQTPGVAFYDPPRPIPAPTKGGGLNQRFGVTWNGLIGGVDGVPNTGAAPRGTLLWCVGNSGNAICLSQGLENTTPRPAAPEEMRRYTVPLVLNPTR